jgi:hypothetical protein
MGDAARRNKNATGHVVSSEVKKKLRFANAGKIRGSHTPERCARISASKMGQPLAATHRAKFISGENRKKAWDTRVLKTIAWG